MAESADDRPESDDASDAAAGRAGLAAQLRQLEDFAARTASAGEALPPQAAEMIVHLREIVQALDSLTASMAEQADAQSPRDARPVEPDDAPHERS
jgi:hypothetical protein